MPPTVTAYRPLCVEIDYTIPACYLGRRKRRPYHQSLHAGLAVWVPFGSHRRAVWGAASDAPTPTVTACRPCCLGTVWIPPACSLGAASDAPTPTVTACRPCCLGTVWIPPACSLGAASDAPTTPYPTGNDCTTLYNTCKEKIHNDRYRTRNHSAIQPT